MSGIVCMSYLMLFTLHAKALLQLMEADRGKGSDDLLKSNIETAGSVGGSTGDSKHQEETLTLGNGFAASCRNLLRVRGIVGGVEVVSVIAYSKVLWLCHILLLQSLGVVKDPATALGLTERLEAAFAVNLTKVLIAIIGGGSSEDEALDPKEGKDPPSTSAAIQGTVFGNSGVLANYLRSSSNTLSGLIRSAESEGRSVNEGILSDLQVTPCQVIAVHLQ